MASDISITSPISGRRTSGFASRGKSVPEMSSHAKPSVQQQQHHHHHHHHLGHVLQSLNDRAEENRGSDDHLCYGGVNAYKSKQGPSIATAKNNAPGAGASVLMPGGNVHGMSKDNFATSSITFGVHQGNNKNAKNPDSRLAVLGSSAVGKSECSYRHNAFVDDEPTCIEIFDSCGQIDRHQFHQHDGFLLVYSITDRRSFEEIARLHAIISEVRRAPSPPTTSQLTLTTSSMMLLPLGGGGGVAGSASFVLVGNKNDLSHERRVTYTEGEQLSAELGCAAFFECSACDGQRELYDAFLELHRDVLRRRSAASQLNRRRRSSAHQVIQVFNKMFTKING